MLRCNNHSEHMSVNPNSLANLKPIKPGETRNPGGKPVGARNRLTAKFLNALADDFEEDGAKAIKNCREQNPAAYIKAIAALCPREIELKRPLEEYADAELIAALNALTGFLASQAATGGADQTPEREPASQLPTVQ